MKARIDALVIEDEPVVRQAARRILSVDDLSVATAGDGEEAMAILEDTQCRIVLSDLMLPGTSGFVLLELIRERWPDTEVVIITGYATLQNALTTFQKGAFDFVAKPFDIGELLGVVRRALRFSARQPELQDCSPGPLTDQTADGPEERCLFLGRHSWARLHTDGSATLGVAETFPHLIGEIERIELPTPQESSTQGKLIARIFTQEDVVHRVWSPLSGTVLAANDSLLDSTDLIDRDPFGQGWLLRIIPNKLDQELDVLDERRTLDRLTRPTNL